MIPWLGTDPTRFPPIDTALRDPDGLLAVGGDLTPEVPLPSGLPLLASGALLFGLVRRKKR